MHFRCEAVPQTPAALVINKYGRKQRRPQLKWRLCRCRQIFPGWRDFRRLVCGRGRLSSHRESHPAPRRKMSPVCTRESTWGLPWWSPGEHDWVEMTDSQGKQTLRCKTVRLWLICLQSQGCFSGIRIYSHMSIHEQWAYALFSFAIIWCSAPQMLLKFPSHLFETCIWMIDHWAVGVSCFLFLLAESLVCPFLVIYLWRPAIYKVVWNCGRKGHTMVAASGCLGCVRRNWHSTQQCVSHGCMQ